MVRQVSVAACRRAAESGGPPGGLAAGAAESAGSTEKVSGKEPVRGSGGSRPTGAPTAPAASPKRCVRYTRHHVNHSGNPCPECNYPLEGAVT